MRTRDFSESDRQVLCDLYTKAQRTLDDLPYTHEFEALFEEFVNSTGRAGVTRHDVWKALAALRKRAELIRKER